jgi:hypothetical protein
MHWFFIWRSSLHFSCNVLQVRWRIKTYIALASGTKQKTEDFEERKNWVLFCVDFLA